MKTITLRDFQLHANKYLKDLPLLLTRFGKPVLKVEKYDEASLENEVKNKETNETPAIIEPKVEETKKEETQPVTPPADQDNSQAKQYGLDTYQKQFTSCQDHYEPGVVHECYLTSFRDTNGSIIWTKWLCEHCFIEIYHKVAKFGGTIFSKQ